MNYGETGGGTSEDSISQAGANAGVAGAHGGTDAAAGASPTGTAGTLERAPDVPESGKDKQQAESARVSNAPLSPPGRDQSKPDSPLFGDKADAAASTDGGGSPAAGAGAAGATSLDEVASADTTRNDASTTGGTGITGGGGSSDAGRR